MNMNNFKNLNELDFTKPRKNETLSSGPFWSDLIFYMAFINVIKCPYKIWSHSEIIWAKKKNGKNLPSPFSFFCTKTSLGPKWILFFMDF